MSDPKSANITWHQAFVSQDQRQALQQQHGLHNLALLVSQLTVAKLRLDGHKRGLHKMKKVGKGAVAKRKYNTQALTTKGIHAPPLLRPFDEGGGFGIRRSQNSYDGM